MPHRMTQAAVAVYALLHLAGWYWPAELWGVDQLHYYGSVVALAFAALCVSAIAAGHSQSVARLDRRAVLTVRSLHLQARYANTAKVVGLLSCVGLAYLLRVRAAGAVF